MANWEFQGERISKKWAGGTLFRSRPEKGVAMPELISRDNQIIGGSRTGSAIADQRSSDPPKNQRSRCVRHTKNEESLLVEKTGGPSR